MVEDALVSVINALEGYRLQLLKNNLTKDNRSLLERLTYQTLMAGRDYSVTEITPYVNWFSWYQRNQRLKGLEVK